MKTPRQMIAGSFAALAVALLLSPPAHAGFVESGDYHKGDTVQVNWNNNTSGNAYGGGEFQMKHRVGSTGSNWSTLDILTFCLEVKEHTVLGRDFVVGGLSKTTVFGSGGVSGGGVAVAPETQFLYQVYATGTLDTVAGLGFSYGDDAWANALQRVIWHFQEQPNALSWQSHSDNSAYDQELIAYATNNASADDDYSVFAINLFKTSALDTGALAAFSTGDSSTWAAMEDHLAQDMLVYIEPDGGGFSPPPHAPVPEPSAVAIWSLALIGVAIGARRRFTRPVA